MTKKANYVIDKRPYKILVRALINTPGCIDQLINGNTYVIITEFNDYTLYESTLVNEDGSNNKEHYILFGEKLYYATSWKEKYGVALEKLSSDDIFMVKLVEDYMMIVYDKSVITETGLKLHRI